MDDTCEGDPIDDLSQLLVLSAHVLVYIRWCMDGSLVNALVTELLLGLVTMAGSLVSNQCDVWDDLGPLEQAVARQTLAKLLGLVQWSLLAQTCTSALVIARGTPTPPGHVHLGGTLLGSEFPLLSHRRSTFAALLALLSLLQLAALHIQLTRCPRTLAPATVSSTDPLTWLLQPLNAGEVVHDALDHHITPYGAIETPR